MNEEYNSNNPAALSPKPIVGDDLSSNVQSAHVSLVSHQLDKNNYRSQMLLGAKSDGPASLDIMPPVESPLTAAMRREEQHKEEEDEEEEEEDDSNSEEGHITENPRGQRRPVELRPQLARGNSRGGAEDLIGSSGRALFPGEAAGGARPGFISNSGTGQHSRRINNFSFEEQVDELVDNFTFLINREKETLREERDALE